MARRVMISTVLGLICGLISLILSKYAGDATLTLRFVVGGLLNKTLMGFVIGTTCIKGSSLFRGALWGFLISLTYAAQMGANVIPFLAAGTFYGIVIDVLVSRIFKADIR